jgi:hypothetical protein
VGCLSGRLGPNNGVDAGAAIGHAARLPTPTLP